MTTYEVELKFPLPDAPAAARRLEERGARPGPTLSQRDVYYAHPCRDFARTDEALRVRSYGDERRVTYKGPLVDPRTKTRREIEIPIGRGPEDATRFEEMLAALGFCPVREVVKSRRHYALAWGGLELDVTFDTVEGLGEFVEIEAQADESGRDAARDVILDLARQLKLENPERRSYLQLLLERDGAG